MFFHHNLVGDRLPRGTLCFTFDDGPGRTEGPGPGPRTAELAAYLRSEGVPATFFAVGRFARDGGDILAAVRSSGHLVANHTYDHPSLPAFVAEGGSADDQLARTDATIRDHVNAQLTYFRAPYGDWWLTGHVRSNVADDLNRSALASRYVGPIGWDIDAGDVGYWRDSRPAEDCARAYLEAIERAGRGIVLMHDSTADIDAIRPKNQALELVRTLVPKLRRRGYRFVALDDIPQVASAARVSFQLTLADCDGRVLGIPPDRVEPAFVPPETAGTDALLGVVALGADRWALRAPSGLFLSQHQDGRVCADAPAIGACEVFAIEPRADGSLALRTASGTPLTRSREDHGGLMAVPERSGDDTWFRA